MPDYKDMLRRQGKGPLGYPSTMPTGKPPRDYSDSPLKQRREAMDQHGNGEEKLSDKERLEALSHYADDNIAGMDSVFNSLPQSGTVQNARFFFGTACLWLQQAFKEAEMEVARQERAVEFRSRRSQTTEALNDQMFRASED